MNEAEWLAATDPRPMLTHVNGKASDRKRHLFVCACWRRVVAERRFHLVDAAIEPYEKFADGFATEEDIADALGDPSYVGALLNVHLSTQFARTVALMGRSLPTPFTPWNPLQVLGGIISWISTQVSGDPVEACAQADLMRHIFGNPFRTLPPAESSENIVRLAEALYASEDCSFALHDALLDAGHVELAEHFREAAHPKGCWALDRILGKT